MSESNPRPPPVAPGPARRPDRLPMTGRAASVGTVAAVLMILAIVFGSRLPRDFDSALLPYAAASVLLVLGPACRYTVWVPAPAARRLFKQGRRSFFTVENFRRAPTVVITLPLTWG